MKFLMSVNHKFYGTEYNNDWIDYCVDGAEIYLPMDKESDFLYLKELALEFKRRELVLSIHAPSFDTVDKVVDVYNEVAEIYSSPITLTIHPHCDNWIGRINSLVDKFNGIIPCIENLDELNGEVRPSLFDVSQSLKVCDSRVKLCLDIGHEINLTKRNLIIDDLTAERISNTHVHGVVFDNGVWTNHGPLTTLTQIKLLESLGYSGNVVYEVALDYLGFKLENYERGLKELKTYSIVLQSKILK